MSEKEKEIIGEDPLCFRCGHRVELGKTNVLFIRGGFVVMHPVCHMKFIDNYRIQKGSVPLEGAVN